MTPERLKKIRALAADERGNPFMRAMAQRILEAHKEPWRPPPDPPNPGLRTDPGFDKFIFMSLDQWGESAKGNYIHNINWKGREYRFILFKYKKVPNWNWLRVDVRNDTETWGPRKFQTLEEAHQSAWKHLEMI